MGLAGRQGDERLSSSREVVGVYHRLRQQREGNTVGSAKKEDHFSSDLLIEM